LGWEIFLFVPGTCHDKDHPPFLPTMDPLARDRLPESLFFTHDFEKTTPQSAKEPSYGFFPTFKGKAPPCADSFWERTPFLPRYHVTQQFFTDGLTCLYFTNYLLGLINSGGILLFNGCSRFPFYAQSAFFSVPHSLEVWRTFSDLKSGWRYVSLAEQARSFFLVFALPFRFSSSGLPYLIALFCAYSSFMFCRLDNAPQTL